VLSGCDPIDVLVEARLSRAALLDLGVRRGANHIHWLAMGREGIMLLWVLVALLIVFWVGGFALNVAGGVIHLLLVMAVIIALYNLFVARRRAL
jgi:Family of unknown function (DUF5670)